jgi:hypothetical protein
VTAWLLGSYVLAISIVEPLYVAGGFALYLNRRTILEGWDVELAFRRLAQRVLAPAKAGIAVAVLALAFAAHAEAPRPREAHGAPVAASPCGGSRVFGPLAQEPAREPKQVAEKVLAAPEFSTKQKVWRRKSESGASRSGSASHVLGGMLQALLWTAFAVAVVAGVWLLLRAGSREPLARHESGRQAPPEALFGLDLREETLPADPGAAALAMFDAGDARGACALLYRSVLARLIAGKALAVRASSTEGECVELVRALGEPELARFFERLTRAWQQVAYAHSAPAREVVVELASACSERTSWT